MKDKVISTALKQPCAYPWVKIIDIEKESLDKILAEVNLINENDRKRLSIDLRLKILEQSKECNTCLEVIENLFNDSFKSLSKNVIRDFQRLLFLGREDDLKKYKKIFKDSVKIYSDNEIRDYIGWVGELVVYYCCANGKGNKEEIITEVINISTNLGIFIGKNKEYMKETVEKSLNRRRLINQSNLKTINSEVVKNKEEINNCFKELFDNEDNKVEVNLADSILGLFDEMEDTTVEELEIIKNNGSKYKNKKQAVKEDNTAESNVETNKNDIIYEKLSDLANELGYIVAKKDEVVVSKEKYELLKIQSDNKKIEMLKDLASLKNGSILSELYNVYKNIENSSKGNIEAILANFFMNLSVNQFDVVENGKEVGAEIIVNTANVLKEFVFDKPINIDGEVIGKVKYLGWKYKNKQVVPMVISIRK